MSVSFVLFFLEHLIPYQQLQEVSFLDSFHLLWRQYIFQIRSLLLRLALLGVLVSLVACGFCFLLSDHWLHTDIPFLKLPGVSLKGAVHTGPHSAKLLSMCPVLLKLVGPPCVLKHMLKYFIEREQSQHLARLSFRDPLDFFLLNSLFTCPTSALLCSLLCAISFLITHPYKFSLCPLSLCLCIPH